MNKVILIVLDGFGIAPAGPGNAITLANPPTINQLSQIYPYCQLQAAGAAVGLPKGEIGSSEVGHVNLGAGRVVLGSLAQINMDIADGDFYKNPAFLTAIDHAKKNQSKLHLIGLLSSGGVHASNEHLYALLYLIKEQNLIDNVYIHIITDGRDSLPRSAITYINDLQNRISRLGVGKIASITGRYFAMDRDHRWERTQKAYQCLTEGIGKPVSDINQYISESYRQNITDEFIIPANICQNGKPIGLIDDNDAVIFYNFRVDRPRQLTKAFILDDFENKANLITDYDPFEDKYYSKHILLEGEVTLNPPFKREKKINNLCFVTMTQYEEGLPVTAAYPPATIDHPLGLVIAENKLYQLRLAESEKERFVSYYFNGFNRDIYKNEDRTIIPSAKVATYDKKPQMSANDLTELLISKINEATYSFILLNFANPDMVAHTGNLEATITAIKVIDTCMQKIITEVLKTDYYLLVTADHGHAEQMIDPMSGTASTAHTVNPVPFYVIHKSLINKPIKLQDGILADVAPTILSLMELKIPSAMTGRNLLEGV